jgi:hypothetical protein
MARTRTGWLVAVVALGLGAAACDKKENTAGGGKKVAAIGGDVNLLPADSEVILGLNFSQLQQSALWQQFSPALMAKAASGLSDFKTACGFDPMVAIKSVSVGLKGLGGSNPDGIVVIHGPPKDKVTGCVEKAKVEAAKNGAEITVDGDVFLVKDERGRTSAWTYIGSDTLIGAIGPKASKATLLAAAKGDAGAGTSQTFVEMYSKINTKDSVWVLINGNASFMAQAARAGVKPKAVFGSINVTDGLSVDMRIRLATPEEANSLVKLGKDQTASPQIKQMVDKLDIVADGADVKFILAMSQQKLTQLMGLFGGAIGSMLGGAMGGMGGP